jgi:hypothetical protein
VFGLFGNFEDEDTLCIHDLPGGKGCYLCDPSHPLRVKEGTAT